jgi:hypothetical protein
MLDLLRVVTGNLLLQKVPILILTVSASSIDIAFIKFHLALTISENQDLVQ